LKAAPYNYGFMKSCKEQFQYPTAGYVALHNSYYCRKPLEGRRRDGWI